MKNYYMILGVDENASVEEIEKAYREKATMYQPDTIFGDYNIPDELIELTEAYDVLSNSRKRERYEIELEKPVYSRKDRQIQETPPINPIYDILGGKLQEELDFFILPKRIGKIIGAFSDLDKKEKPLYEKEKKLNLLKGLGIGLAISTAIYFLASLTNIIWIGIWFIVPTAGILLWTAALNSFIHRNLFVGINGFAEYKCEGSRKNITISKEVNFDEVTDLHLYEIETYQNSFYEKTDYRYFWLNYNTKKVLYLKAGTYDETREVEDLDIELNYQRACEKQWTDYLLDRMEENLQKKGHITFNVYPHEKGRYQAYIKLGVGQITFIKEKEEFTYKFSDIKKIYAKGNELRIQHNNFKKSFFFSNSGNEDVIPLLDLCNRKYFFIALGILLGYKLESK